MLSLIRITAVGALIICILGLVTATAPAGATSAELSSPNDRAMPDPAELEFDYNRGSHNDSLQLGRPSHDVNVTLSITYLAHRSFEIKYEISYPARNSAEAEKARNNELDPKWFEGKDRVSKIFDEVASNNTTQNANRTSSYLEEISPGAEEKSSDDAIIHMSYQTNWHDYPQPGADLRIGEHYVSNLNEGSNLWVKTPPRWEGWEPSRVSGNPSHGPQGEAGWHWYVWTISEDMDTPLLVIEDPPITTTDEEAPLGVAGGVILTLVALLGAVSLARFRASRQ